MTQSYHNISLTEIFFNPLVELYPLSDHQRDCPEISDLDYLVMGVSRCVSNAGSGNDFLQSYRMEDGSKVSGSHFFEALKKVRPCRGTLEMTVKQVGHTALVRRLDQRSYYSRSGHQP